MVQNSYQFGGLPNDDPNKHIVSFLEICDTQKFNGVPVEAFRLILFPISLKDKAKMWWNSLPKKSISTWEELISKFSAKYFQPARDSKLRGDITTFVQFDNELIHNAWERYKEVLRECQNHGLPDWLKIDIFYKHLKPPTHES